MIFVIVFQLRVVKTKLELSIWLITENVDSPPNIKVTMFSRYEAEESVWEQVTIGFVFTADCMRKWHVF